MQTVNESSGKRRVSTARAFSAGVAGAAVVALAVAGLGLVGAGAQEPTTAPVAAAPADVDPSISVDTTKSVDEYDEAAWAAYDACFDEQLGVDAEAMDKSFDEEFDAQFRDADLACRDQLPVELQKEMVAWDDYDKCMTKIGYPDESLLGGLSVVSIDTPDGYQTIDLGSGPSTVTITSDGTKVSIDSTGDATVLDEAALDAQWAEFDKAASACDKFLPADAQLAPSEFAPETIDGVVPAELPAQG